MSDARAFANQKLYFASLQLALLRESLDAQERPAAVLREALGQSVVCHLRDAYGWFLLQLAEVQPLPLQPPASTRQLLVEFTVSEPLRGELVELRNLEAMDRGWLHSLLAVNTHEVTASRGGSALNLASEESPWDPQRIADWHEQLQSLVDRMSDSLDEW